MTVETITAEGFEWVLSSTFLCQLKGAERADLLASMVWRSFERNQTIVEQGRPSSGLHLLVTGQAVALVPDLASGWEQESVVTPGRVVGARALVNGRPEPRRVKAICEVRTLYLARKEFDAFCTRSPAFKRYIHGLVHTKEHWAEMTRLVSRNKFLRVLGRDDTERILEAGVLEQHEKDVTLVRAGEPATDVFVVVRGRLAVVHPTRKKGVSRTLALKVHGDLAGETALILDVPQAADIRTVERSRCLRIDGRVFKETVTRNPFAYRQILQAISVTGTTVTAPPVSGGLVVFIGGTARELGSTTLAYGLAASLARDSGFDRAVPVAIVDLDGVHSAKAMGLEPEECTIGLVRARRMAVPGMPAIYWPHLASDTGAVVSALRSCEAGQQRGSVVVVTGRIGSEAARACLDDAGAVVVVRQAGEDLADLHTHRHQFRSQAIRVARGRTQPLATSRKAVRIPDDPGSAEAFWRTGAVDPFLATRLGAACGRLARVVRGSSVGVALGGGGAFGFAHIALIRALAARGVPVDFVAGVSFGSLVGALYAGGGLRALDDLLKRSGELVKLVMRASLCTDGFQEFVDDICGGKGLEETDIPFYPVGLDLASGKETVLHEGSLGLGVRSASSMPGLWPTLEVKGKRIVDGGMVNNVPVSTVSDAGADFLLGSNIIPPGPEGRRLRLGDMVSGGCLGLMARVADSDLGRRYLMFGIPDRLEDLIRSLYMLMSQVGRDRSIDADYPFELEVPGFDIFDFHRGTEIVTEAGKSLSGTTIEEILGAYREDASRRF